MLFNFAIISIFLLVSVVFIFGNLMIGFLGRPRHPTEEKLMIYECGEPTIGGSWIRYNIRFYTIALVYLIFDVEVVFLFPVALVLRDLGPLALFEVFTFVGVLVVGLIYAWRYGNLDWISSVGEDESDLDTTQIEEISMGV